MLISCHLVLEKDLATKRTFIAGSYKNLEGISGVLQLQELFLQEKRTFSGRILQEDSIWEG